MGCDGKQLRGEHLRGHDGWSSRVALRIIVLVLMKGIAVHYVQNRCLVASVIAASCILLFGGCRRDSPETWVVSTVPHFGIAAYTVKHPPETRIAGVEVLFVPVSTPPAGPATQASSLVPGSDQVQPTEKDPHAADPYAVSDRQEYLAGRLPWYSSRVPLQHQIALLYSTGQPICPLVVWARTDGKTTMVDGSAEVFQAPAEWGQLLRGDIISPDSEARWENDRIRLCTLGIVTTEGHMFIDVVLRLVRQ